MGNISDVIKYAAITIDSLKYFSIFIEPADSSLILPNSIEFFNDEVRLTGQFYKDKGFPKSDKSQKPFDSARVFRYTKYEILKDKLNNLRLDTAK
jgi:hypothetical protein